MADIIDLIVAFRGGEVNRPLPEIEVFPEDRLASYNSMALQAQRRAVRIGFITATIRDQSAGLLDDTMRKMREALKDQVLGRIFIFGTSSGGRNAIDLALRLSNNNRLITYLGVLDAAFFPNETSTTPGDPLKEPPEFNVGFLLVAKKQNFFQLCGNGKELTFHGRMFTSDMRGKEIHGKISGFDDNINLTDETNLRAPRDPSSKEKQAFNYHKACVDLALPRVFTRISQELTSFKR
jgi:hypothetical protein